MILNYTRVPQRSHPTRSRVHFQHEFLVVKSENTRSRCPTDAPLSLPRRDGNCRGYGGLRLALRLEALYVTVKYVLSSVENGCVSR